MLQRETKLFAGYFQDPESAKEISLSLASLVMIPVWLNQYWLAGIIYKVLQKFIL